MFDDNHIDDLMKSILESGQEEVPARVWDGITEGLDRAERRKTVVLWFRRAGAVAAAAAVAAGVVLNMGQKETFVPEAAESDMIAVVHKHEAPAAEEVLPAETPMASVSRGSVSTVTDLVAYVEPVGDERETPVSAVHVQDETPTESTADGTVSVTDNQTVPVVRNETYESWEEDETRLKSLRLKTSIVLSGIAGTNSPQNKGGISPMRSPAMSKTYTRTTVEQTSTETLYGIPLSFGAGVRLRFTDRWSLGMGLNYTLLTSKFNGKYIKVTDGVADAPVSANVRNLQHYVGIPINTYYDIVSRNFINFYAYAGGAVEKCVMNRYQVQTSPVIHHTEGVKGVQLSVNAGIGVEFMLGRYVGLYIDPSLRYYFRNGQPKSLRTAQPLMLGFEMGLRFKL